MSKESEAPKKDGLLGGVIDPDLSVFLERCVELGATSLADLRDMIDDDHLFSLLVAAETKSPLEGAQADAESLARELKEQANCVANVVGSRAGTEKEE